MFFFVLCVCFYFSFLYLYLCTCARILRTSPSYLSAFFDYSFGTLLHIFLPRAALVHRTPDDDLLNSFPATICSLKMCFDVTLNTSFFIKPCTTQKTHRCHSKLKVSCVVRLFAPRKYACLDTVQMPCFLLKSVTTEAPKDGLCCNYEVENSGTQTPSMRHGQTLPVGPSRMHCERRVDMRDPEGGSRAEGPTSQPQVLQPSDEDHTLKKDTKGRHQRQPE